MDVFGKVCFFIQNKSNGSLFRLKRALLKWSILPTSPTDCPGAPAVQRPGGDGNSGANSASRPPSSSDVESLSLSTLVGAFLLLASASVAALAILVMENIRGRGGGKKRGGGEEVSRKEVHCCCGFFR